MIEDAIINAARAVSKEELVKLLDSASAESAQNALLKVARQENTEETILALVDLMADEQVIAVITNAAINMEINVVIRICEETEPSVVVEALSTLESKRETGILDTVIAAMPAELLELIDAEVEEASIAGGDAEEV